MEISDDLSLDEYYEDHNTDTTVSLSSGEDIPSEEDDAWFSNIEPFMDSMEEDLSEQPKKRRRTEVNSIVI